MRIHKTILPLESRTQIDFLDITESVREAVRTSGIRQGNVTVFVPHTTMGVVINHNEPLLLQDFMRVLYKAAPVDDHYSHDLFEIRKEHASDGRSNGHSHCKALLIGSSETILVERGELILSPIQSIFALEFDGARKRDVIIQVMGI
ncbi:MAG: YjbQ family protein [Candidatus Moraniibacteriota bacterium]|nr:MAG: YjbQ family protein [Candidatus Moranbacteria bacterium]